MTKHRSPINSILRTMGLILGIAWILFGIWVYKADLAGGWYSVVVAIGFIGTGVYFINYGLTGRSTLGRWGRIQPDE